ncbi:Pycsar system effector family protein [Saccharomonospora cyanea]|uniref:Pycsar effector protein domain-containing protein n=1 Tax=Saccharomonospora cyanea NA-134 TaxID=882082 RepID=H5XF94_9PSEU|nr:Pycsar system effector family protein [Saccharomonospora cyanea]EHR61504.1 hypothetical protein SaccyDRAFT_2646 [Saccharomonospora cyanea NA-134]
MTISEPRTPWSVESALSEVRTELGRTDQKAATLLTLFSVIAAGLIAGFAGKSGLSSLWNGVEWMAWTGIALLAASLTHLLIGVRPSGATRSKDNGSGYFARYAHYVDQPDALREHLATTATEDERCHQLVALSVLVTRKYRLIARAVDLLGGSLVLIGAAVLIDMLYQQ